MKSVLLVCMDETTILTLTTIFLPILAGAVGYLYKSSVEKKRELYSEVSRERRAAYQLFVNLVLDILNDTDKKIDNAQHMKKLHEFYKKNILFASPEVALAFGDYMQFVYQVSDKTLQASPMEQFKRLTKVMKVMRTDLGLSNKDLGENGEKLLRGILRDFDKLNLKKD